MMESTNGKDVTEIKPAGLDDGFSVGTQEREESR